MASTLNTRPPLARMAGFSGLTAASAFAPILLLPVLSGLLGMAGWAALALGESIGLFFANAGDWGWTISGPSLVARASEPARREIFRSSVNVRLPATTMAAVSAGVIAYVVAPDARLAAAAMAVAACCSALLPTWYAIGSGDLKVMAVYTLVPKIVAIALTAGVMGAWANAFVYPIVTGFIFLGAATVASVHIGGIWRPRIKAAERIWYRENLKLVVSGMFTGGYTRLASTIVVLVAPADFTVFVAAIKVKDLGAAGLLTLPNALRGWASSSNPNGDSGRARTASKITLSIGVLCMIGMTIGFRLVEGFLFSDGISLPIQDLFLIGATLVLLAGNMSMTYYYLAPSGNRNAIASAGVIASIIGVSLIALFAAMFGATGGLGGVLCSELASGATLWLLGMRRGHNRRFGHLEGYSQ